jgi:hypothetical protein
MSDAPPSPSPRPYVGSGRNGLITEDEARSLLEEHARSGLTLRDFAASRGLNPQRLDWWRAKFAGKHRPRPRRSRSQPTGPAAPPRFVPLVVARDASPTRRTAPSAGVVHAAPAPYVLDLGRDLTLCIPHDFRDDALARIVRVLREAT